MASSRRREAAGRRAPFQERRFDPRLGFAVAFLAVASLLVAGLLQYQPAGIDYLAIWAGGRAAAIDLSRLYDFAFVTDLQGWPLGPEFPRPFPYPPSLLPIAAPLAQLPPAIGYVGWTVTTGLLAVWAGRRFGAPWWFVLYPWVAFAAYCGQVTFLILALVLLGMSERWRRPVLSGVLFGIAAAIKPQLLVLLPVALLAERRVFTIVSTGATGLVVCAGSALLWRLDPWWAWVQSLPKFLEVIADSARMLSNAVTPTAALRTFGLDPRWALLTIPVGVGIVWSAFRRRTAPETQLVALIGGGMLASPYAMNYELAMFAPAVGIYLSRTRDRSWIGYLCASVASSVALHPALINLIAVLAMPALEPLGARLRTLDRWRTRHDSNV